MHEAQHDLPDAAMFGRTVGDSGVLLSSGREAKKIAVMRYEHAIRANRVFKLLLVRRAEQPDISSRRCVNSTHGKSLGNGVLHALVEMETELHGPCP